MTTDMASAQPPVISRVLDLAGLLAKKSHFLFGPRQTGKTFYLLDEPTTGLHFDDVRKLLQVLHRLTDLGNTIVIIEHNLDVIRNADWLIDLGPEGGEEGGRVVAQGTPEQVARNKKSYTGQALASYFAATDLTRKPLVKRTAETA